MTIDDYDFEEILPATPENLFWKVRNGYSPGTLHLVLMERRVYTRILGRTCSSTHEVGFKLFKAGPHFPPSIVRDLAQDLLISYSNSVPVDITIEKH